MDMSNITSIELAAAIKTISRKYAQIRNEYQAALNAGDFQKYNYLQGIAEGLATALGALKQQLPH